MNNTTKIVLYFSFVILAPWLTNAVTDYCKESLCHGDKHIACNHNKLFDTTCPSDAKLVELTPTLQKFIVRRHNMYRNFVAGGKVWRLSRACRMGTMKWDKELAEIAELNVMQCKMAHDSCRNTDSYQHSGQNLGLLAYRGTPNHTAILADCVDMWYNEVEVVKPSIIKKLALSNVGPMVGHFTEIMLERNIAVGCGASTYSKIGEEDKAYLVACNFGYANFIGHPVYKFCKIPGKECETGVNPKYPNLCSKSEKYAVNEFP